MKDKLCILKEKIMRTLYESSNTLSTACFGMAPVALFCFEGGILACILFILLGFWFKHLFENGYNNSSYERLKARNELWETQYKQEVQSRGDIGAREWANEVCRRNNGWIPPEEIQTKIANQILQERHIKTEADKREERHRLDKIQFGKWYLLKRIEDWYSKNGCNRFEEERRKRLFSPQFDFSTKEHRNQELLSTYFDFCIALRECVKKIQYYPFCQVCTYFTQYEVFKKYGVSSDDDAWMVLSKEEKEEAKKWVKECVERVFVENENKRETGKTVDRDYNYKEKYGFCIF